MDIFSRTAQLLGRENLNKIKNAKIAVFGLGAVGSFALEALARSGAGRLYIIDFDIIDLSNLNRQLLALHSTIGRSKSDLACARLRDINPGCRVTIQNSFVNNDSLEVIFDQFDDGIDVVVDAIDGLNSKVNLLVEAKNRGLAIVSSMGAAGRRDISMIRSGDISQTSVCPLARVVRRRLHRRGIYEGIRTVYSVEKPLNKQAFEPDDLEDMLEDHGRPRPPLGSVCWVTGAFGLMLAQETIQAVLQ